MSHHVKPANLSSSLFTMATHCALSMYSLLDMAFTIVIVSGTDLPLTQIRPFMPTASSYGSCFPSAAKSGQSFRKTLQK